jgi:hypothetical protein
MTMRRKKTNFAKIVVPKLCHFGPTISMNNIVWWLNGLSRREFVAKWRKWEKG